MRGESDTRDANVSRSRDDRVRCRPRVGSRALTALLLTVACEAGLRREVVQCKGSDTVVNLAQSWAEVFEASQSQYSVAVSGGGSGTGIAALVAGTADIATSSRALVAEEIDDAIRRRGAAPEVRVVARDALSIFVHPDNPLEGLSFDELACIYGDLHQGGDLDERGGCEHWSDVRGVVVPGCADNRIVRVSRQSNSGTAQYFREAVVGPHRDLRLGSLDLNGSSEAVQLVAHTPCAIGYVGLGYLEPSVRALCVVRPDDGDCVSPSVASVVAGRYPIARDLYMMTFAPAPPGAAAFLAWVETAADALAVVEHTGYVPVAEVPRNRHRRRSGARAWHSRWSGESTSSWSSPGFPRCS